MTKVATLSLLVLAGCAVPGVDNHERNHDYRDDPSQWRQPETNATIHVHVPPPTINLYQGDWLDSNGL